MTATEGTLDETGVEEEGYKEKYKNLKRKLESLLYEQECFNEELRKVQKRCLQVSRDKSFLLDRLLQYEKVIDSSTDDEMTESSTSSSEDEIEPPQKVVKTKSSAKSNVKKASNTPQKPETATPPTQKSGKQTAKSTKRETAQNKVSKPAGKKIGEAENPKQKSPPKRVHPPVGGKDIRTIQEAMEESSETCSSEETEEETEEELVIDLPR